MSSAKVFFKAALHWYPLSGGRISKTAVEVIIYNTFSLQTDYEDGCSDEEAVEEHISEYLNGGVLDDLRELQTPFPEEGYIVVSGEFEVKWATDYFGETDEEIGVEFHSHTFCTEDDMIRRGLKEG